MRVVGTAGHVDHGKSTLVQALTGIHPDRLKEEQAREMTIDLGFAWMTLPGESEAIGIVDVPGHRDFIENMLAGVGGMDAVLFVVAADEGVMPQTREHLAILDLLSVPSGLVVLTKSDLVDAEWLDLVREDVRGVMQGSVLQDAPILAVSARSGAGLEELKSALGVILRDCPPRLDHGRPRLPVDRVFTIAGFGTVVTGTLLDGQFRLGDEVQILPNPSGVRGRVRGLQTHKLKVERAVQGSRVAINISGVDVTQVKRGDVIAQVGTYTPTRRMDVDFRLLADIDLPLKHGAEVKFFLGAAEVKARARLLGVQGEGICDYLSAGNQAWLQLELDEPVVAIRGDRYILRRPSPGETLGGGQVLDAHPQRRHKRFDPKVLAGLQALRQGSPGDILMQAWMKLGASTVADAQANARLSALDFQAALEEVSRSGALVFLDPGASANQPVQSSELAMPAVFWRSLSQAALSELEAYHKQVPLRRGMPREEFKSRLKLAPRIFVAVLRKWASEGLLIENGAFVALAQHEIRFSSPQQIRVDRLMAVFQAAPYTPPAVKECQALVGEDVFTALLELDELVLVSEDVVFRKVDYDRLVDAVKAHFRREPGLTVAQFRDQFNTSRRYALAFLEHLDACRLTIRDGDLRRINPGASLL